MSWYIPENSKIVFSLSASANRCIDNDRITFANSEKGVDDFSDFVIVLMQNFAPHSETAIGQRIAKERKKYTKIGIKESAISKLLDASESELQDKARKRLQKRQDVYPAVTRRFNCSTKIEAAFATDCIAEESSREVYGNIPGRFIRALLEEYAELPFAQRERYYFMDTWNRLNDKIGKCIELTTYSRINRRDESSRNKIRQFKPYSLEVDPTTGYNYVVGVGRELNKAKEHPMLKWEPCSYRLCRIVGLKDSILGSEDGLTKDDLQNLSERRKENDVSSMTSKAEEVTVAFTADGRKTLCQIGINRPRLKDEKEVKKFSDALKADLLSKVKENKKLRQENGTVGEKPLVCELTFVCPAKGASSQAQTYFRRFGQDAVIRSKVTKIGKKKTSHGIMRGFYSMALKAYDNEDVMPSDFLCCPDKKDDTDGDGKG